MSLKCLLVGGAILGVVLTGCGETEDAANGGVGGVTTSMPGANTGGSGTDPGSTGGASDPGSTADPGSVGGESDAGSASTP